MPKILLAVYDIQVSTRSSDTLVARNLATSLGLSIHDPAVGAGGMLTSLLPFPLLKEQEIDAPLIFLKNSFPSLLAEMRRLGAEPERMVIKAAGCATLLGGLHLFNNGQRNDELLDELLERHGLKLAARDTGGTRTRTMTLHVGSGAVRVESQGEVREL
ncbi:MAG: hypothetical protein H0S85_07750 [Desulfovibrionaceae bacterium]|jgi:chemotaxis protein CheD|nr:hypothetical protein [Desulfovibrionaceae bacterium]